LLTRRQNVDRYLAIGGLLLVDNRLRRAKVGGPRSDAAWLDVPPLELVTTEHARVLFVA
jgi:hypothetical protein